VENFKKLPKMQCFKTGGSVKPKFVKAPVEKTTKVAATGDKKAKSKSAAMVPKEKEEKVDISTMKKGGRAKKATGTVKKFVKPVETKAKAKAKPVKKFADGGNTGNPNALSILNPEPGVNYGPGVPFKGYGPTDGGYGPGYGNTGGPNFNPTFNNNNTMNAGGGGGYGVGAQQPMREMSIPFDFDRTNPFPVAPPGVGGSRYAPYGNTGGPNFNPVFNNTNTMNANGGYGGNDGGFGGANPMTNPGGQQAIAQQSATQAPTQAPAGGSGGVNLLPGLFGAK
jgi:hypothetical protein